MRLDKSRENQLTSLRPIKARQSLLNRCHGSSRFSFGDTTCLTGIYEHLDQQTTFHNLSLINDSITQNLINELVKCLIKDIKIHAITQVIHDDGSILSVACNSVIFAMIDAGGYSNMNLIKLNN
jgi:ribonuclease PH